MRTLIFSLFSAITLTLPIYSHAQSQQVAVTLKSNEEILSAVGLLFDDQAVFQVEETTIQALDHNTYQIAFSPRGVKRTLKTNSPTQNARVSAIALTASGKTLHATTSALQSSKKHVLAGPTCPLRKTIVNGSRTHSSGIFHQIIQIREEKRTNHQAELSRRLTQELRERLEKLERYFGLSHGEALSAELPPFILVQRLSRLHNSIATFKQTREKQKLEQAAVNSDDESDDQEQAT